MKLLTLALRYESIFFSHFCFFQITYYMHNNIPDMETAIKSASV